MSLAKKRKPLRRRERSTFSSERVIAGVPLEDGKKASFRIKPVYDLESVKDFTLVFDEGEGLKVIKAPSFDTFRTMLADTHVETNWLMVMCANMVYSNCFEHGEGVNHDASISIGGTKFDTIKSFIETSNNGINALLDMCADVSDKGSLELNIDVDDARNASIGFMDRIIKENGNDFLNNGS